MSSSEEFVKLVKMFTRSLSKIVNENLDILKKESPDMDAHIFVRAMLESMVIYSSELITTFPGTEEEKDHFRNYFAYEFLNFTNFSEKFKESDG